MVPDEWLSAAHITTGMEHTAWLIGVIGFIVASVKGLRAWRKTRDEAIAARTRQEDAIAKVLKQFQRNGGSSLYDKVEEGNRKTVAVADTLNGHVKAADDYWSNNDKAHDAIHRRIDGMFELFAGGTANAPRKTADRHSANRAKDEEG